MKSQIIHFDLFFQMIHPIYTIKTLIKYPFGSFLKLLYCKLTSSYEQKRKGKSYLLHPITALQIEYSLWSSDIEAEVLPTIRELGIGLVAYAPPSRGFLSGEFKKPEDIKDSRPYAAPPG